MGLGQILSPIYSIFRIYEAFFCPFQKLKTEKKSICKAHLAQKNQVWSRLKISAKINKANLRAILMDFIIRNENHIQISINLAKNDIFWRRYFGFWKILTDMAEAVIMSKDRPKFFSLFRYCLSFSSRFSLTVVVLGIFSGRSGMPKKIFPGLKKRCFLR